MLLGVVIFGAASIAAALAPTGGLLILARSSRAWAGR